MSRVQTMFLAVFAVILSMISIVLAPSLFYANAEEAGKGEAKFSRRMDRALGAEAPWISIALRHRTELSLTEDQVANLEKARTHYQNQSPPVREQLLGVEKEIASLLQETPANLIQVKQKIEQSEKLRSELRYLRIEALENGRSSICICLLPIRRPAEKKGITPVFSRMFLWSSEPKPLTSRFGMAGNGEPALTTTPSGQFRRSSAHRVAGRAVVRGKLLLLQQL